MVASHFLLKREERIAEGCRGVKRGKCEARLPWVVEKTFLADAHTM